VIDELLNDLATQGWLINNCYQTECCLWRISLRRPQPNGDWFTEWAEGNTMEDALTECMSKLLDAEFALNEPIRHSVETSRSLVDVLGLIHKPLAPAAPIKRRF
jgi:hypothetical protein